jgi:hypothetical protein
MRNINLGYFYVFVLSAIYAMVLFNGFYYMILWNFDIFIDVNVDVLWKGFLIGFTGAFICNKLGVRGFIPFGWFGALFGLQLADFVFMIATPYGSFFDEGIGYAFKILFTFFLAVAGGSVLYLGLDKVVKVRYYITG